MTTKQAKSASVVETMRKLQPTSAAWILGYKSSRSIRDLTDVPVNPNGTFDASKLLAWARGSRAEDIELPTDTVDELLCFFDSIPCGLDSKRFLDILDEQISQHGDSGKLAVFDVLVAQLRQWFVWFPKDGRERTEAEIRQSHEESAQEQIDEIKNDPGPLRILCTCHDCGSVRRGGKWSEKNKVPSGWRTLGGVCDSCMTKSRDSKNGEAR